MEIKKGQQYISRHDEIDFDDDDNERVTPAGSTWVVSTIVCDGTIQLECPATGGWISPEPVNLMNEFIQQEGIASLKPIPLRLHKHMIDVVIAIHMPTATDVRVTVTMTLRLALADMDGNPYEVVLAKTSQKYGEENYVTLWSPARARREELPVISKALTALHEATNRLEVERLNEPVQQLHR